MREPLHWDGRAVDRFPGLLCAMIGCMGIILVLLLLTHLAIVWDMLRLRREGFLHSKRLHDELQCSSTGIQRIKS